ncbi:DNA polymerase III subunit alpha [Roseomonas hellenica]|uniref:Error-prone DNA polymerase n=1 Tax=Plastoroseomonas hellenica TaxID=2687306 RepID=A0ABS5EUL6_9PROT|nr:error-prone DNA polymerase [Plastoroseomonas hellenica]MBR0663982.1 DNA polymerase III subunit alpha [Plastoroseomonas hellenica]
MEAAYAELGAQSNFSFLDGASHPHELVQTAKRLGLAGLGICDTNSLAGVVRGHVAAKEAGLPFRVGARLELLDGSRYLAWPTDRASYGRLTRLLSHGRMTAPKGECWITREDLIAHRHGLVLAALPPDDEAEDDAFLDRLRADVVDLNRNPGPMPLLCAVSDNLSEKFHHARAFTLVDWAFHIGVPPLAINNVRFHHRSRRRLADVLSAIRLGVTVDRLGHTAESNEERCLKSPTEMAKLFPLREEYGYPLELTLTVLEATEGFSLDQLRYEYPDEILEPGRTPQQTLEARVAEAAAERWPEGVSPDIAKRLAHELRMIAQLDYAPYFLTVHEIVRFARSKGILCQGRGSAANSAVCYVLGVTAVDPAKHDLLFERFVSASRGEPPDIDIDFEHERREEVIQHLYEKYGRERAAICATVIRYRSRSAIREVGKAMGLSEDATSKLAKGSWGPGRDDGDLGDLARQEGMDPRDQRLSMALELADEIRDFPRHVATHVGGFVITRGPLTELAVVTNAAMQDRTTLEWDKDDVDALRILKVDVLGLGMLSCIRRAFGLLRMHKRLTLDLAGIPKDDPATYEMLRRADSLGVFQVESRAQMNMLPRLRPKNFYDLVIQVAIVRPGPIQGDMVHPFIRRRWGLEEPEYAGPSPEHGDPDELKRVLGKTLGVPLFQEQAMQVAIVAAGFSPDEADQLRRAMATFKHTGGVGAYRDRMVTGMTRRGYPQDFAERAFRMIEGFGSYGFPESHAASFAHLVYASSWIKCHHPGVFACALLNSQPMGFYAPAQIIRDARKHGVAVRPIDVNVSEWDSTLEPDEASTDGLAIRLGLRVTSGLSEEEGRALIKVRAAGNARPFASVEEAAMRAGLSRKAVAALVEADSFAGLAPSRPAAHWAALGTDAKAPRELPLFAAAASEGPLFEEPAPALPEETPGQAVVHDYQSMGLTLRQHPLALLRPQLDGLGLADTRKVRAARQGQTMRLPGLVLMRQRPATAKGVVFVTVEDEFGDANLVVYAKIGSRDRRELLTSRLLVAEGRIERVEEHAEVPLVHLIVRRLVDRSDLLDSLKEAEGLDRLGWADRALGRADEVRRPDPGLRSEKVRMKSRDFR